MTIAPPPSREAEIAARQTAEQIVRTYCSGYQHINQHERDLIRAIESALTPLLAQRQQAREALTKWSRHDPACDAEAWEARNRFYKPNYERPACTCGLDAALKDEGR
jgi:hypothetical protein